MRNILKGFLEPKAEAYVLPSADEIHFEGEEELLPPVEEEPAPAPAPSPAPQGGATMSQEEIERMMAGGAPAAPAPAPQPAGVQATAAPPMAPPMPAAPGEQPVYPGYPPYGQPPMAGQYPYPYPPYPMYPPQPPEPKVINAAQPKMKELSADSRLNQDQKDNLDLILSVSLEVAVEIGRTRRKIQDILAFSKGSLVVLDKLAGDQVDLLVNGQCVAKGDVVVIDDNFGIRITEILQKPDINELAQG